MADLATQSSSANPVTKPASTIGGNAPPTPPETQEVKSAANPPSATLSAPADEPAKTSETPSAPVPAATSESEPSKALGGADASAPVNGATTAIPGLGTDSLKAKEAEADQLAAQPDKPSDNAATSTKPINAEPAAAAAEVEDPSKQPPKPVSLEDVPDPDGPATKLTAAEDVVKPDPVPAAAPPSSSSEKKDAAMTDAQPTVATGPAEPAPVPAVSEASKPKPGQKRKAAEEPAAVNGSSSEAPTAKKQKESPLKKVADKVTATVKKAGRPKKEKKERAPVGQTARKTRSQGKADEQ